MEHVYRYYLENRRLLAQPHLRITQQIPLGGTVLELRCDFLEFSFSEFPETRRFFHPSPPFSRLIIVERGSVHLEFAGQTAIVVSPCCYLLPAGLPFRAEYTAGSMTYGFHIQLCDSLGFTLGPEFGKQIVVQSMPLLQKILKEAIERNDESETESVAMLALLRLSKGIFPILRQRLELPDLYQKWMIEYQKAPSATLRLADVAKHFHQTPAAFAKAFRRRTGMSWKSFQSEILLDRARRMLNETTMSVSEIAHELGFSDVNYFYSFFRSRVGIPPRRYRLCCADPHGTEG